MKKFLTIFFVLIICILITGCGCERVENNNTEDNEIAQSLYTDDSKLVYKNEDIKMVFYYENDIITNIEHYYMYASNSAAKEEYEKAIKIYEKDGNIKDIKLLSRYVIYTINSEDIGKTKSEIEEIYSYLVPVYK